MDPPPQKYEKIKLVEINSYLTCYLCKGYLIDATTISECLHSFCRSCIIKFLQENCYCPVCEVIINKAKPCLKLDKTLQDIVYKLVPGLFVKEMYRRKEFYQNRPALAPKVSPEERGEDTERTIFNPQDAISLSIEYISDDSAPGAIPSLTQKNNGNIIEESQDNPMKRYLQCPGMCRIEVLKKFVRNKYNVDTNLFHIDILYKRVPLPDHYTLIDIGYIYSWKRNEPMKFFFRITDINKVAERFDYFDGRVSPEVVAKRPNKLRHNVERTPRDKKKEVDVKSEDVIKREVSAKTVKSETVRNQNVVKKEVKVKNEHVVKNEVKSAIKPEVKHPVKLEVKRHPVKTKPPVKRDVKLPIKSEKVDTKDDVLLKPEITEELKNKIQSEKSDVKKSVYTNITLNREDNVEIITKIQKVSNKEGLPIGLNINHTVKKANKVQNVPSSSSEPKKPEAPLEDEIEKSNFLKSIELTAKSSLEKKSPPKPEKKPNVPLKINTVEKKPVMPNACAKKSPVLTPSSSASTSSQKRKNSSPMKTIEKKAKIEKKPMKIIIQPKGVQNAAVRQMVSNVNQNANNMSKIVESTTTNPKTDLQSLIDNCKINIPSSLSITLNEGGEGGARTPPSIPPVKNFIEILKIPDNKSDKNKNLPSFQKIFEESIVKKEDAASPKQGALDLSSPSEVTSAPKRKILEIASQLQKKTKAEQEKKEEKDNTLSIPKPSDKVAIPRLATQRTLKPPKYDYSRPQTSASMHSSTLGLNYTVSVGQNQNKPVTNGVRSEKRSPSSPSSNNKNLSSSQLLEKYNIQNLAQLTASLNYGALQHAMMLKQMEHNSWLNQAPLLQFEKYMQSLSAAQNKILGGNIKEN